MNVRPTCTVSTDGLSEAIRERLKYPGRTEAKAVNTSAYWIAVNTKNSTPFASIASMDEDLGKLVIPATVIDRYGNVTAQYRGKKSFYGAGKSRKLDAGGKPVPLAALIIAARVKNPPKHSNWRLAKNPFAGVSRSKGASAMKRLIDKMVKGRHSSAHFLQSGWVKAVQVLRKFAVSGPPNASQGNKFDYDLANRGDATPAREGSTKVFAQIVNNTGEEGVNRESVDAALQKYGTAPLQAAIDRERNGLLKKIEELSRAQNDKFNHMAK